MRKLKKGNKDIEVVEAPDGSTRTVTVKVTHSTGDTPWHDRDELEKQERASLASWNKMDTEERQSLALIVTDILRLLCEDPEIWIPTSTIPRPGHHLDVWIGFSMDEMDAQVVHLRAEAERQLLQTKQDLQDLDRELAVGLAGSSEA